MKAPEGQWLVTSLSKKNKGEERKNEHRFWKTCKEALSRDTGQWNGNSCRAIWGWAHSHGISIQVKPMNLGQIYQHQSSPSRSHIEQKPLSKTPTGLGRMNGVILLSLSLNSPSLLSSSLLSFLHLNGSRSTHPSCWGGLQKVCECWRRYECCLTFSSIFRSV